MFEIKSFGKLRHLTGITPERFEGLAANVRGHYRSFDSRLRGGKWRHIDNPDKDLKSVQGIVLVRVLREVKLPKHMYGARRGVSIKDHAKLHEGQPCILALDLRNCFPRTTHERVHGVFLDRLGCNPTIARLLTQLCTLDHHLPQGAPTSPYLAHLCLLDLYADLRKIAQEHALKLSFYVDDIALSGSKGGVMAAYDKAIAAILKASHGVRNKKKKLMEEDARVLTGIAIRERICVPPSYVDVLERDLIDAARLGSVSVSYHASLKGRVQWVSGISTHQAEPLEILLRYVEPGTERHRVFPENKPCTNKANCLWRGENRQTKKS